MDDDEPLSLLATCRFTSVVFLATLSCIPSDRPIGLATYLTMEGRILMSKKIDHVQVK
jgi:hypothetical protein